MQSLWEEQPNAREKMVMVAGPVIPQRLGDALNSIPFVFFGSTDLSPIIDSMTTR